MTKLIASGQMVRYAASIALACAVIETGRILAINGPTVTLNLVLAVLALGTWWGFPEALIACVTGSLGLDYFFLPPDGFGIADPQEWWMMAAFISTALVGSSLSARARKRALEAKAHQIETAGLYRLSQGIRICDTERETMQPVPEQIAQIFGFREVAFHDSTSDMTFASTGAGPYLKARLRDVAQSAEPAVEVQPEIRFLPLQIGDRAIGSIGFREPFGAEALQWSIAAMVAALMQTSREHEKHKRTVELRAAQELKSTLLDAVAHDFKTPMTSIRAAVSCLLSQSINMAEEDRELLQIIREEVERLGRVADAASAKVLEGLPHIAKYPVDIGDVICAAVEQFEAALARRVALVDPPPGMPPADIDPILIEKVVVQLLDNALKYSPPESAVTVSAGVEKDTVVIHIADSGSGIAEDRQLEIFQPLYRCPEHEHVAGSGMGLSIAKRIMDAHGGNVWVTSRKGAGSVFHISVTATQEVAHV